MKLKFLIFVMALAAMGPAQDAPPPDPDSVVQRNPARLPPIAATPAPVEAPAVIPGVVNADAVTPDQFLWASRPVVVFADTPEDPAFVEQLAALQREAGELAARDVVVIIDSNPTANSIWRQQLRPRGFSLVVIDKDGQVKIRRPSPLNVREIGRAIDRLTLRRQEVGRGSLAP